MNRVQIFQATKELLEVLQGLLTGEINKFPALLHHPKQFSLYKSTYYWSIQVDVPTSKTEFLKLQVIAGVAWISLLVRSFLCILALSPRLSRFSSVHQLSANRQHPNCGKKGQMSRGDGGSSKHSLMMTTIRKRHHFCVFYMEVGSWLFLSLSRSVLTMSSVSLTLTEWPSEQ